MTEAEWLACDDPEPMLRFLKAPYPRKGRLFGCACCRRITATLNDVGQKAIDAVEQFADGNATQGDVLAVSPPKVTVEAYSDISFSRTAISCLVELRDTPSVNWRYAYGWTAVVADNTQAEWRVQADFLRCIFGNPFRPVTFDPAWRTDTALALARQMYEAREFSAMPILADALQDAGCDNTDVLNHCRDASQIHVRGCWVVDLVLGKE